MGNIFLLHVIYKMHDPRTIYIVMINVKRNIVIIEHLYKIGIKTSFTIYDEIPLPLKPPHIPTPPTSH